MAKKTPDAESKKPVTVFLSQADYERLTEICKARHQTRADFLRDAIVSHEAVSKIHAAKLRGICLELHERKVRATKRAAKRARKN